MNTISQETERAPLGENIHKNEDHLHDPESGLAIVKE